MTGQVTEKTTYGVKTERTVTVTLSEDEAVLLAGLVGACSGYVSQGIYDEFERLGFGAGVGYTRKGDARDIKITSKFTGKEVQ